MSARTKGAGILKWSTFVEERFGVGTMARLLASAPPELRALEPSIVASGWYPVAYPGHIFRRIADDLVPERREQNELFEKLGRVVAEDNLSSIYRLLLTLMSPDKVLGMTPRLWTKYFDGITVTVSPGAHRTGTVVVEGLQDLPYIAPIACGWLTLAYELCRAEFASVREQNWTSGRVASNRLVFEHRWG